MMPLQMISATMTLAPTTTQLQHVIPQLLIQSATTMYTMGFHTTQDPYSDPSTKSTTTTHYTNINN